MKNYLKTIKFWTYLSVSFSITFLVIQISFGYINSLGGKNNNSMITSGDWNSLINNMDEIKNNIYYPPGIIMYFENTNCPTGWSEYIPARGRFIRGIDNGAGNDPDCSSRVGGCVVGSTQGDEIKSHNHAIKNRVGYAMSSTAEGLSQNGIIDYGGTDWAGGTETRPKNVALLICSKN